MQDLIHEPISIETWIDRYDTRLLKTWEKWLEIPCIPVGVCCALLVCGPNVGYCDLYKGKICPVNHNTIQDIMENFDEHMLCADRDNVVSVAEIQQIIHPSISLTDDGTTLSNFVVWARTKKSIHIPDDLDNLVPQSVDALTEERDALRKQVAALTDELDALRQQVEVGSAGEEEVHPKRRRSFIILIAFLLKKTYPTLNPEDRKAAGLVGGAMNLQGYHLDEKIVRAIIREAGQFKAAKP